MIQDDRIESSAPLPYAGPSLRPRRRRLWLWLVLVLLVPVLFIGAELARQSLFPEPSNIADRPDFKNRQLDAVVAEWGPPTFSREMSIGEAAELPFRGSFLQGSYSSYDPADAVVRVRELTWDRRRTYVTVWFHQVDDRWLGITGVQWHRRMRDLAELSPPPRPATSTTAPPRG
jgi:hypothetical protein